MSNRTHCWASWSLALAVAASFAAGACRRDRAAATVAPAISGGTASPGPLVTSLRWPARKRARVVLVGDTGLPGPAVVAVAQSIRKERKDAVVVLGDLVYPWAPRCPGGRAAGGHLRILRKRLAAPLAWLGAPVILVLGNHDVRFERRAPLREACLRDFAARYQSLILPANSYSVDLGVALLSVINTNDLTRSDGERVARETSRHRGWRILLGHHVLRTYHDKDRQDYVLPWLRRHKIRPDLYANGHAHVLQFGIFEGIPAVTSGSGAKLRKRKACPPHCGKGQHWGVSRHGYAVLDLDATSMRVTFKDQNGISLWSWSKKRTARK